MREREENEAHGRSREARAGEAVREENGGRTRRRGGPPSCRRLASNTAVNRCRVEITRFWQNYHGITVPCGTDKPMSG